MYTRLTLRSHCTIRYILPYPRSIVPLLVAADDASVPAPTKAHVAKLGTELAMVVRCALCSDFSHRARACVRTCANAVRLFSATQPPTTTAHTHPLTAPQGTAAFRAGWRDCAFVEYYFNAPVVS